MQVNIGRISRRAAISISLTLLLFNSFAAADSIAPPPPPVENPVESPRSGNVISPSGNNANVLLFTTDDSHIDDDALIHHQQPVVASRSFTSGAERRAELILAMSVEKEQELKEALERNEAVQSGPGRRYWKGLSDRASWTGFYFDDFEQPQRRKRRKKDRAQAVEKVGKRGRRASSASRRRPRRSDTTPPVEGGLLIERGRYFFPSDLGEENELMWFEYPQTGREMVRTVPRSRGFYLDDMTIQGSTWGQ